MNVKEKFTKCKEWVKEHKKVVIGTGIAIVAAGIGAIVIGKTNSDNNEDVYELPSPEEHGRDCTMKFVVDETQEIIGEIPCTELYAKEEIEIFNETVDGYPK